MCVRPKIARRNTGNDDLEARFARLLGLVERLLVQKPKDKNKLYSLHAPEVDCISKGKARNPYEFGCKVGIATTNREGLVLAAKSFEGNPYDGRTLAATVDQAVEMVDVDPDRIYLDKGYRGHDYAGSGTVMIAGSKRGLTTTMKRELKRRSAIEATIGHMKTDGRLDRHAGDAINAHWPQSAPHPGGIGALACMDAAGASPNYGKLGYCKTTSRACHVNRLAIVQGGLLTSDGWLIEETNQPSCKLLAVSRRRLAPWQRLARHVVAFF